MTDTCYTKAKRRKQLTFTLVEQDLSAPLIILEWIQRNFYTTPTKKLREAFDTAVGMAESATVKKNPD